MSQPSQNGHPPEAEPPLSRPQAVTAGSGPAWLARYPWLAYVLPFAVFMLVGLFEPTADKPGKLLGLTIEYSAYPLVYAIKMALVMAAIALVWPVYRQFAFHIS